MEPPRDLRDYTDELCSVAQFMARDRIVRLAIIAKLARTCRTCHWAVQWYIDKRRTLMCKVIKNKRKYLSRMLQRYRLPRGQTGIRFMLHDAGGGLFDTHSLATDFLTARHIMMTDLTIITITDRVLRLRIDLAGDIIDVQIPHWRFVAMPKRPESQLFIVTLGISFMPIYIVPTHAQTAYNIQILNELPDVIVGVMLHYEALPLHINPVTPAIRRAADETPPGAITQNMLSAALSAMFI